MTVRRCAAATASLLGAVWGCGASHEAPAMVNGVTPDMAYNDAATTVRIAGKSFRPAYRFDTMGGAASSEAGGFSVMLVAAAPADSPAPAPVALEGVSWLSDAELEATIPAAVAAGAYDVVVVDPRGEEKRLPVGFTSLGPDDQLPTVAIDNPGPRSLIGDGATISVRITADDGLGFLSSVKATLRHNGIEQELPCGDLPPAPTHVTCQFDFTAPAPLSDTDTITLEAQATDRAGNDAYPRAMFTYPLARRPSLIALSPMIGPAGGGTPIVVRGSNFVEPTQDFDGSFLLFDGLPVEGEVVDSTTINARTPAHAGIPAKVTVSTGGAESSAMFFTFISAPKLRTLVPDHGPVAGGTWIAVGGNDFRGLHTVITIDGQPLLCQRFVSPQRIEGVTPPGKAPGTVLLVATDRNGGSDMIEFTYDEVAADPPDGGADGATCTDNGPS